jgi:transcriptional regulator with XRE-family HTH domain
MATNEVPRGPVSGYLTENVKRLRAARRWSLADLSNELEAVGRPILSSGLHRLEQGKRRVDADDLVALAAAFHVSPISLLLPADGVDDVSLTVTKRVAAQAAWDWMRGRRPLELPTDDDEARIQELSFLRDSFPKTIRDRYPWTPAGQELLYEDHPDKRPQVRTVEQIKREIEEREGDDDGEHQETP